MSSPSSAVSSFDLGVDSWEVLEGGESKTCEEIEVFHRPPHFKGELVSRFSFFKIVH